MKTGACRYCGQTRAFDVREAVSDAELDEMATEQCDCAEAKLQRERQERLETAKRWAQREFEATEDLLRTVQSAIKAAFEGVADHVTVKVGRNTYKIDTDSDGLIRIKQTYKESTETVF